MPEIEIDWIKIKTDMFDNEKIKLIRKMPEGDAIINTWIQLICLAGKCNKEGAIVLGDEIAYTDEMLTTIFDRELPVIRLALSTFQNLKMIEWQNGKELYITNFSKHQNIEGLDRVRKLNADRNKEYRKRLKLPSQQQLLPEASDVTVTSRDGTDKNRIDKNRIDKKENIEFFSFWDLTLTEVRKTLSQPNHIWLEDTQPVDVDGDCLIVAAKTEERSKRLFTLRGPIERAICKVSDNKITKVEYVVMEV